MKGRRKARLSRKSKNKRKESREKHQGHKTKSGGCLLKLSAADREHRRNLQDSECQRRQDKQAIATPPQ